MLLVVAVRHSHPKTNCEHADLGRLAVNTERLALLRHTRRKPAGVVAIAVSRELAAFLWEAATLDV